MLNPLVWASFAIVCFSTTCSAILCYRCTYKRISKQRNITDPIYPCGGFRRHKKYLVNCPYSTLCHMKTIRLDLTNGEFVQLTQRDCADQSVTYYRYSSTRGWHHSTKMFPDRISEGCQIKEHHDRLKLTLTEQCHCSGDRCNGDKRPPLKAPVARRLFGAHTSTATTLTARSLWSTFVITVFTIVTHTFASIH